MREIRTFGLMSGIWNRDRSRSPRQISTLPRQSAREISRLKRRSGSGSEMKWNLKSDGTNRILFSQVCDRCPVAVDPLEIDFKFGKSGVALRPNKLGKFNLA